MNTVGPRLPRQTRTANARPNAYRPTLLALAVLCALLALLILLVATPAELAAALRVARRDPGALAPREFALLVLAACVPIAAGLAGYVVAAQAVRLLRLWLYLGRLHAYAGRRLRAGATLYNRGLAPQVEPVTREGQPRGPGHPATRLLASRAPVLLTGEPGSGKSTALLVLAYELSRRRAVLPVFLGRRRLPVLVPLAGYAAELRGAAGPQLDYLQRQVARYGSPGLALRLPRLLRSGRVLLLCDSLADAPLGAQRRILEDLAVLPPSGRGPAVILAQTGALGEGAPEYVTLEWRHWRMAPLRPEDTLRRVQAAVPRGSSRKTTRLREELAAHRLDRALRLPGLLALATARPVDSALPYGSASLLRHALDVACVPAAGDRVVDDPLTAEALRSTLATLASALLHADLRALPLPPGVRLGDALADWLSRNRPYSPLAAVRSGPLALSPELAHACCLAALRAGLLSVASDDSSLTFSHSLIEAGFAAQWLADADDGASPFDPGLLRPRWALPLILWTATIPDPGTVTRRLLALGARPATSGPAVGAAGVSGSDALGATRDARHTLALATPTTPPRDAGPTIAALALAGISAALAPRVSAFQNEGRAATVETQHEMARFERRLREVLDAALELLTDAHDPKRLGTRLREVEGVVGDELAADIAYLAAMNDFSRLARAQLITTLGLLGSPLAIAALVERLADKDATLRAAAARGFTLAGGRGVEALQGQLASPSEWVRARAREYLDGIRAAELAMHDTARTRAIAGLASPEPAQRSAAAETLGALQAHDAVDALVGRLTDSDVEVAVAVLRALGRIADPSALPVLREQTRHVDPAIRAALAETLGAYRDPLLIPDLALLLDDSASAVRAAAATALGVIGHPAAVEPLRARQTDPDPRVGAAVASALRRLGQSSEGGPRRPTGRGGRRTDAAPPGTAGDAFSRAVPGAEAS